MPRFFERTIRPVGPPPSGHGPCSLILHEETRDFALVSIKGTLMKGKTRFLAAVFGALAATLLAQESASNQQTTQQTTTVKTTTVSGSVVQYSPGQTIVIRSADGKSTTYSIGPKVEVPEGVVVGKTVTISTQPASDGSGPAVVTRIVTTTESTPR